MSIIMETVEVSCAVNCPGSDAFRFVSVSGPGLVAGAGWAGFANGVECVRVGDADLAGFLDDFEGRVVVDPVELIW
jgi:hypothetical protein